jgi:hypothetical protein
MGILADISTAQRAGNRACDARRSSLTTLGGTRQSPHRQALEGLLGCCMVGSSVRQASQGQRRRPLRRLTRQSLLALHRERFAPSELTAVVVGDVEPDG